MAVERLFESFAAHHDPADLLDALATGIVLLDSAFAVVHANVAAQGLMAVGLNQARGRAFCELFTDGGSLQSMLLRARDTGESLTECDLALRSVGSPKDLRVVDITVTPIDSPPGARRMVLELADAEPRNRLNRDSALRARLESSRMMTSNLAHEIKNPLGGIRGAAQLLQMEVAGRDLVEYTQVIVHEADRLQLLVDRLLAPHRRPHVVGDVNIHEVCERVRTLVLAEFPRGLKVVRDYDISIPEIRGDREQLIQAVLNIVHNAAHALFDRITTGDAQIILNTRVARQVTFGKQRYRLALELHVIDNGPGIPEEIKERLFFPLVSGRDGGSGLGLNLAQTFVQQHHGLIECDSVVGRTDFKILIPLP